VTPAEAAPKAQLTAALRFRLVAVSVLLLSLPLAVALFLAALLVHQTVLVRGALAALTVGLLAQVVISGWRGWLLWKLEAWRGLDGRQYSRAAKPGLFAIYLSCHLFGAATLAATASYLAWIAASPAR